MRIARVVTMIPAAVVLIAIIVQIGDTADAAPPGKPATGETKQADLGHDVTLEVVYIPAGEFKMGSTPAERAWATGIESFGAVHLVGRFATKSSRSNVCW